MTQAGSDRPVICVVEDDTVLRRELVSLLEQNGHRTSVVEDFAGVVDALLAAPADLILLDLGLPGVDGLQVCRELRARTAVPVIVLTSRATDVDELMAMTWGADDFIAKPFVAQVLLARIAAVLRRSTGRVDAVVTHRGVTFAPGQHVVSYAGRSADLTRNEEKILRVLLARRGAVVSREELVTQLWREGGFVDENTLTVNVNRLRRTLQELGVEDFVHTIRGRGYGV